MRGEEVRGRREDMGLSQTGFAGWLNERLGRAYDRARISRWESGAERVPKAVAEALTIVTPEDPGPAYVVAVALQKGGVGKTTACVNLCALLYRQGYACALIDADPQANATLHLGVDPLSSERDRRTLHHVLRDETSALNALVETAHGFHLLPSSLRLSESEGELAARPLSHSVLRERIVPLRDRFDFIVIDNWPAIGHLLTNALVAAEGVLIPCQTEPLSVSGVTGLLRRVREVQTAANPSLDVLGILPTLYNGRLVNDREKLEEIRKVYSAFRVFDPVPRATAYPRSVDFGVPLLTADAKAPGSEVFAEVGDALIQARDKMLEAHS